MVQLTGSPCKLRWIRVTFVTFAGGGVQRWLQCLEVHRLSRLAGWGQGESTVLCSC